MELSQAQLIFSLASVNFAGALAICTWMVIDHRRVLRADQRATEAGPSARPAVASARTRSRGAHAASPRGHGRDEAANATAG